MLRTNRNTTLTIAAIAGFAVSAPALLAWQTQDRNNNQNQQEQRTQQRQQGEQRVYVFQSADELLGKTLKNAQGEDLATIDDMIIDRGTGKVEAVVIREGGFLGFGGTHVAVPWGAFTTDTATASLTLNAATNMLEGEDARLPDGWQRLEDDWDENLDELVASEKALMQKLPRVDKGTETRNISGTITQIKRVDLGDQRHWLAVRVSERGQNGEGNQENQRTGMSQADGQWIVLGPSWYAVGGVGAPVRGEQIEVEAFEGLGSMMHAKRATFGGDEVAYRDDNFEPMWTNRVMRSESARAQPGPMVLLTDIMDQDVVRGGTDDEIGEVDDAFIELTGGNVAILSVDIGGDWWGPDDGHRAVPFDVAWIGKDHIALDASEAMLERATHTPDDARTMTMPRTRDSVFVVFEVPEPMYTYER